MNYKILKVIFFSFYNNQYYLLYRIETDVDVNMKLMSDNIRQSKDTQTEDNEEDKSQEVCFF